MNEEKLLEKVKELTMEIINTKIEGVKQAKTIQDMIDNGLYDLMSCPSVVGLKELDDTCGKTRFSCERCWQYAIAHMNKDK